ncbi:MAG: hypothetical protein JRG91_04230 [Deltaproteobacteria bacterium]|nr:hypothetical protein [Deltaproteobacteria bacterium]
MGRVRAGGALWLMVCVLASCGSHEASGDAVEESNADPVLDAADGSEDVPDTISPRETDEDGDTISDADEGSSDSVDTDEDGTEDYLDLDSDGDSIPDEVEAGDELLDTPPRDTDGDGAPDFRDTDSDDDGLSDAREMDLDSCDPDEIAGCCPSPYDPDSDGDGVTDYMEMESGSDPCDYEYHWSDAGVFWVPYEGDPMPAGETFGTAPWISRADVFFSIDSSPSMSGEIDALRSSWSTSIAPAIAITIGDVRFGAGMFTDCSGCTTHMSIVQAMTPDHLEVQTALDSLTAACGTTPPYLHALYTTMTGNLTPFAGWGGLDPLDWTCTELGEWGWPCFRSRVVPIVIQIGDKEFDGGMGACAPGPSHAEAVDAMNFVGAKYIGINSGAARPDMEAIAGGTGTKDLTSTPLVFNTPEDGSGLASTIATAIGVLTSRVLLDVSFVVRDDPGDDVDATVFIDRIVPSISGEPLEGSSASVMCTAGLTTDGDSFAGILPGTPVCFDVHPARNTTVEASAFDQLFGVEVDVLVDGIAMGETFDLTFVVPGEPG